METDSIQPARDTTEICIQFTVKLRAEAPSVSMFTRQYEAICVCARTWLAFVGVLCVCALVYVLGRV